MAKAKAKRARRKKAAAASRGISPREVADPSLPAAVETLVDQLVKDGAAVLASFRDPLGGHWQILAALPLDRVEPTSFQRDLSDAHVKRLADKIERLDRFLDPIIAVRGAKAQYLTPNGHHRVSAMKRLGSKTITALVVPEFSIAYQILALNTEKAYNVREKSLEAIRLARELAGLAPGEAESDYGAEFEEPAFLTLGACYERQGRFSGGAYQSVLRKTGEFLDDRLPKAISRRERMAERLLKLDGGVQKAVDALKDRGLKSPYLRAFVVARINPLRFSKSTKIADFDDTLDRMESGLGKFDPEKIQPHHLSSMGGPPAEES